LRKRIEEVFGWIKAQAGFAQVKVRGRAKAEAVFTFAISLQPDPTAKAAGAHSRLTHQPREVASHPIPTRPRKERKTV